MEFNTPVAGFVWFNCKQGDELKVGEVFCHMDSKKIDSKKLININEQESRLVATNKAKDLIELYSIEPNKIKKSGIIKLKDVEKYIGKTKE